MYFNSKPLWLLVLIPSQTNWRSTQTPRRPSNFSWRCTSSSTGILTITTALPRSSQTFATLRAGWLIASTTKADFPTSSPTRHGTLHTAILMIRTIASILVYMIVNDLLDGSGIDKIDFEQIIRVTFIATVLTGVQVGYAFRWIRITIPSNFTLTIRCNIKTKNQPQNIRFLFVAIALVKLAHHFIERCIFITVSMIAICRSSNIVCCFQFNSNKIDAFFSNCSWCGVVVGWLLIYFDFGVRRTVLGSRGNNVLFANELL